jgi:hypothetical protein
MWHPTDLREKNHSVAHAYYQVIIATAEDELQRAVNKLNQISKKYEMKISSSKTKQPDYVVKTYKWSKYKLKVKL